MVVVTGSTGFVGGHIMAALGARARGLSRDSWTPGGLASALTGAKAVVHAASVVHKPSTPDSEYERFNVEGTRALLDAAEAAGVERFVFVSSIKVYGETPVGMLDENAPVLADAPYARTKAEAERLVLARTSLRPIVLRLCPVYGRGDKGNVRTILRAIQRRRFLLPGDGSTRKSIVHVSTVVKVVERALETEAGGVFVVANRDTPSVGELAATAARLLGRRRPRTVPVPILRAVAALVATGARLAHVRTPVSPELIDKSLTSSVCDPGRVERELGVDCAVDLESALADEIAWLRSIRAL